MPKTASKMSISPQFATKSAFMALRGRARTVISDHDGSGGHTFSNAHEDAAGTGGYVRVDQYGKSHFGIRSMASIAFGVLATGTSFAQTVDQ
jgi:hypothetical protein